MAPQVDTSGMRRFLILLYKGLLLRKRHYVVTAFEIIFPVLVASIPAIIVSETNFSSRGGTMWVNETFYKPFNPHFPEESYSSSADVLFAFTPSNKHTDKLINHSIELFKSYNPLLQIVNISSFEDEFDLESFCLREQRVKSNLILIGTVFNNDFTQKSLPSGLDYTIRYSGAYGSLDFYIGRKYRFKASYIDNVYRQSYFLSWQAAIEETFINEKFVEQGKEPLNYQILMQQFPFIGHKAYEGIGLSMFIPTIMVSGLIIFTINLVKRVLEEKCNGSKELLKMMGMTNFTYWSSTFTNFFSIGALTMLIITIIYKSPLKNSVVLLNNSNFFIIFFIFLLFIASLILFCMAITCFFNKVVMGIIFVIIVYNLGSSLLSTLVFKNEAPSAEFLLLSPFVKFCICLFPSGALFSAFQIISALENSGEGSNWSNLYSYDVVSDFNLSQIMLTMIFSCFMYIFIIWYVDAVWPWQPGVPKPFYFPFMKSYWCGYKEAKTDEILLGIEDEKENAEFFEDEPVGISPGVVIKNLSKVFRSGLQTKVAVNNVSLNFYNGQITALLGHNGAGKTTTINILTGLYSPSGGSASINGWDIFKQTAKARQSIGVCPQHNVLYDTLTVEEHLKIYAALKGIRWSHINEETSSVLNMLHLCDKRYELTKNLSGGMKRKLCLGIAIIGGSKVLFLDEPTSGMDVEARRSVWDALLDFRHNRTVVLTTHYMEEADILGDRIAIMADGEIQCCGSPLFLKKKFGTGYHLHMVKNENFNLTAVTELLIKYVPNASLVNNHERDVTFNLMSSHSSFGDLFEELETEKGKLGINSSGITVTTMEDVFLNVSKITELKANEHENGVVQNTDETELKDIYREFGNLPVHKNINYVANQLQGLIIKRFHYSKRHWSIFVTLLVIPFIMLTCCLLNINAVSYNNSMFINPLRMNIKEVYGKTDGFCSFDHNDLKLYANKLSEVLKNNGVNVVTVKSPDSYILDYGNENLGNYIKKFIVGGTIEMSNGKMNLTAWYNGLPFHGTPMSLLLMNSAILRSVDTSGYIALTNHPLPNSNAFRWEDESHTTEKIFGSIFTCLAFSFVSASFVMVPIHERTTKAKLIQLMTGIPSAMYWFAMFVWDFSVNIVVSILLIIPFAIFAPYAFFAPHSEAIGTAVLLMILYGWSSIPFSYIFSLVMKKPNNGFSVVNTVCVLTGLVLSSILTTVHQLIINNKTAQVFIHLFKLFPSFSLASGFGNLFSITYANAYCDLVNPKELKFNCDPRYVQQDNPIFKCCNDVCADKCLNTTNPINFEKNGCAIEILFLFFDGILYFLLLLLLESPFTSAVLRHMSQNFNKLKKRAAHTQIENSFIEDSDVLQEEQRVFNDYLQLSHSEALVALNLSKTFKSLKAVDHLSFGIHKKECFGLLGVNGAGKTTTFRMLTGDCYPDEGNAYIGSCSVITNLKEFQSHIGYCPQFDALIDRLTAHEMITLFARLRGLSGDKMERAVNALIKMTDLTKYADKPSLVYSGGNKRKLSIALSLIGSPPLLLLDEPTAGVDPVSRRKIWKILSLARNHTKAAVILTTHSMEESEALCSRLAIMVNGRFRCLGSIQELKTKFGQGYSLIIKMKKEEQAIPQSMNAIKAYIDANLASAQLKDDHQGMLQYHVVDPSMTLSYLFKFMHEMKEKCNLEDYVISDTSLEQIFLAFARSQRIVSTT